MCDWLKGLLDAGGGEGNEVVSGWQSEYPGSQTTSLISAKSLLHEMSSSTMALPL